MSRKPWKPHIRRIWIPEIDKFLWHFSSAPWERNFDREAINRERAAARWCLQQNRKEQTCQEATDSKST